MVSPDRSRIIINGKFAGRSPYIVQNPEFFDFDYKIKRRGYETYVSRDSFDVRIKSIPVTMNSSYKSKRFFLTITIGTDGGVYGDNNVLLNELDYWPMYGMTFGIFGRTGIYGSAGFTSKNINNYWVRGIVNKVRLAAGVSQQFGKSMFIYFGPGCTTRKYSFDDYTSTWKDESRTTVDLNTGLIFRIGWYSLLQIDYSKGLNEPYMAIGIGLGINLPKKSK
jgi:hypothetical protein